jgi:hypothetical protein
VSASAEQPAASDRLPCTGAWAYYASANGGQEVGVTLLDVGDREITADAAADTGPLTFVFKPQWQSASPQSAPDDARRNIAIIGAGFNHNTSSGVTYLCVFAALGEGTNSTSVALAAAGQAAAAFDATAVPTDMWNSTLIAHASTNVSVVKAAVASSSGASCLSPRWPFGDVETQLLLVQAEVSAMDSSYNTYIVDGPSGHALAFTFTSLSLDSISGCEDFTDAGTGKTRQCPTEGGVRLIINGSRLEGATATVGGRVCNVSSGYVSSATQMECLLPAGVGQSVTVTVTNDHGQIGTARLLSYALPVVYNISGCGAVATSGDAVDCPTLGASLVLLGDHFGNSGATVTVGGERCSSLAQTNGRIACTLSQGVGANLSVVVAQAPVEGAVVDNATAATMKLLSYSPPQLDRIEGCVQYGDRIEGCAIDGGQVVTVTGEFFGANKPSIFVASATSVVQACSTVTVLEQDRKLECVLKDGTGVNLTVVVRQEGGSGAVGLESSMSRGLSYVEPPLVTSVTGCAGGSALSAVGCFPAGGDNITIRGVNFGGIGSDTASDTASVSVNGFACLDVLHSLSKPTSELSCRLPAGTGAALEVAVLHAGQAGTMVNAVSYLRPVISRVMGCGADVSPLPIVHDGVLSLNGSAVGCPTSGVANITVDGFHFGPRNTPPKVLIGGHECAAVRVVGYVEAAAGGEERVGQLTRVVCVLPEGVGTLQNLTVQQRQQPSDFPSGQIQYATAVGGVSYLPPSINGLVGCADRNSSSVSASISASGEVNISSISTSSRREVAGCRTEGGGILTITGSNFGTLASTSSFLSESGGREVRIGRRVCEIVNMSHSELRCRLSDGVGIQQEVQVWIAGQSSRSSGSSAALLSYSPPTINRVTGCTAEGEGGSNSSTIDCDTKSGIQAQVITITGSQFGPAPWTGNVTIGTGSATRECVVILFTPHSQITCRLEAGGVGVHVPVVVTAAGQSVDVAGAVSFLSPTLSLIRDYSGNVDWVDSPADTTGGTRIRVEGKHFGTSLDVASGLVRVLYWVVWGPQQQHRHYYEAIHCTSERNRAQADIDQMEELLCEMAPGVGTIAGWEVVVGGQQSLLPDDALRSYRYISPVITSITPDEGINNGGYDMTISGGGFGPNATFLNVTVGGSLCLDFVLTNDTSLVCTVPSLQSQLDDNGQRIVTVSAASQESEFAMAPEFTYSGCPEGQVWNARNVSCMKCAPGTALQNEELSRYASHCAPCESGTFQHLDGQTSCIACDPAGGNPQTNTETADTTVAADSAAFCTCLEGYYRIVPAGQQTVSAVQPCGECPAGADCTGGNAEPIAKAGYWKTEDCISSVCYPANSAASALVVSPCAGVGATGTTGGEATDACARAFRRCKPAEACPAGAGFYTSMGADEACTAGYMGDACGECSKKYYALPLGGGVCEPCPQLAELWLALYFVAALFACVLAYLLSKKGPDLSAISIGTTFLQVYSMLGNFDIKWPNQVEQTFRFAGFFRFEFQLVSPECSADLNYFERWCVLQLVPLMMVTLYGVGFCFVYLCKRYVRRRKGSARMSHLYSIGNAMLMMLDFMYITLCTKIFELFDCVESPGTGKYYLQPAPTVECYTDEYWTSYFPCGMAACIVYAFGIPFGFMYILVRNKEHIQQDQLARIWGLETSVSRAHGLKVDTDYNNELAKHTNYVRKKYSILYEKYKPSHYYWSVVLLMRKFAIVASITLFSTKPMFQAIVVLWVLFVSFVVQREATPFKVFTHDQQSYNLFRDTAKKRYLTKKYGYRWLAFTKRRRRLRAKRASQRHLGGRSASVDNLHAREQAATLQYQTAKRQAKGAFLLRSGPSNAAAAAAAAFEAPIKGKAGTAASVGTVVVKKDRRGSMAHALGAVQTQLQLPFGALKVKIWLPLRIKTLWRSFKAMIIEPVKDPLQFSANYNRMESMFIMVAFHVVLAGVLFGSNELCGDAVLVDEAYASKYGCLTGWGLWLLVALCLAIVYGALLFGVVQVMLELYKALYSWEKGRRIARLQLQRQHELAHVRRRMKRRETRLRRQELQQEQQRLADGEGAGGLTSVQEDEELDQGMVDRKSQSKQAMEELEEASLLLSSAMFVRSGLMPLSIFEDNDEALTTSSQSVHELIDGVDRGIADAIHRNSIDSSALPASGGDRYMESFHSLSPIQVLNGLVKRHRLVVKQQYAQVKALDWLEKWVQNQQEIHIGIGAMLDSIPVAARRASLHGLPLRAVDGTGEETEADGVKEQLKATRFSAPHMTGKRGSLRGEIGKRVLIRQAEPEEGPYDGKHTRPATRKTLEPYNSYHHQHYHGEHHHRHHYQPAANILASSLTRSAAVSYDSTTSSAPPVVGPRPHLASLTSLQDSSMSSVSASMHELESDAHVVVLQWLVRFFQWGCGFAVLIYVVKRMTTDPNRWGAPRTLTREHEIWLLSNAAGTIFFLCISICADAMLSVDELKNIIEKRLPRVLKQNRWLQPYMHSAWDTFLGLLCFCLGVALLADVCFLSELHDGCTGSVFTAAVDSSSYTVSANPAGSDSPATVVIECPAGETELTIAGTLLMVLSALLWRSASQLCDTALKRRRHQHQYDMMLKRLEAEDDAEGVEADICNPLSTQLSAAVSTDGPTVGGTKAATGTGEGDGEGDGEGEGNFLATIAQRNFRELLLRAALAVGASGVLGFATFATPSTDEYVDADKSSSSSSIALGGDRLLDTPPTFRAAPLSLNLAMGSASTIIAVCVWCWLALLLLLVNGCCARKKKRRQTEKPRLLSRLTTVRCRQVALGMLIVVIALAAATLASEGFCSRPVELYIATEGTEEADGSESESADGEIKVYSDCPHVQMTLAAALAGLMVLDLLRSLLRARREWKGAFGKQSSKSMDGAAKKEEGEEEGGILAGPRSKAIVHHSSGRVSSDLQKTTI